VSDTTSTGEGKTQGSANITVIKKYANRRLYNTATSTYVTLEDLSRMVKEGAEFAVYDAKTGEDITRSVLTQIIFEEENKEGNNLLPINFLRQLIQFYGNSMQAMVPGYLEFSLGNLMKEQDKIRQQMTSAFGGGDAFKSMEEQAKRNMELFQQSLKMFPGFNTDAFKAMTSGMTGAMPTGFPNPFAPSNTDTAKQASKPAPSKDELQALKDQLSDMQQKLDALNRS
jgi:polyhydroxyalkanoate synthesis repressor PhaR